MQLVRHALPKWHDARLAPGLFGLGAALSLLLLLNAL